MQCLFPALASCVELLAQNHFPAAESLNKCSPSSKICCAVYWWRCSYMCLMCRLDSSCIAPSYKTCSVSYLNASLTIHECCAGALWSAFQMVLWSWLWLKLHGVLLNICYLSGTLSLLLGCRCCLLLSVSIWSVTFLSCNDLLQFYVAILDLDPVFREEGAYTWHIIEPTSHPSPWFHWKY